MVKRIKICISYRIELHFKPQWYNRWWGKKELNSKTNGYSCTCANPTRYKRRLANGWVCMVLLSTANSVNCTGLL